MTQFVLFTDVLLFILPSTIKSVKKSVKNIDVILMRLIVVPKYMSHVSVCNGYFDRLDDEGYSETQNISQACKVGYFEFSSGNVKFNYSLKGY